MTLLNKVKDYIKINSMLQPGDLVLAAVSGGADSICLLLCLIELSSELQFDLQVFHYDHNIRKESSKDADFVKEKCSQYGIECHVRSGDVLSKAKKAGISTEEAARNMRYEAMYEVADSMGSNVKLAFAHNLSDRAETVLFRLFRGTGIKGLRGIKPVTVRKGHTIIRPLLEIDRTEIEGYLTNMECPWVEDATNQEDDYARNRIRHHIISYARDSINAKAVENISMLSKDADETYEYIQRNVRLAYKRCEKETGKISTRSFLKEDRYIQRHIILYMLEQITSHRKDVTRKHVESIIGMIETEGNLSLNLPYGIVAIKEYDEFYLKEENEDKKSESYDISFSIAEWTGDNEIPSDKYTKLIDYDKIINQPEIRTRQTGDYIYINDKDQRTSLKKYFINEKIPPSKRDEIMLVADGSSILWIVGYRISAKVKITKNTKRVLKITATKKE